MGERRHMATKRSRKTKQAGTGIVRVETDVAYRDEQGRFIEGNPGSPGRPPREREEEFLDAAKAAVSIEAMAGIFAKATQQALDGDASARRFVCDYLLGKPREHVTLKAEVETGARAEDLSNDELAQIIVDARRDTTS